MPQDVSKDQPLLFRTNSQRGDKLRGSASPQRARSPSPYQKKKSSSFLQVFKNREKIVEEPPPVNKEYVDASHFVPLKVCGKGGFGMVYVAEKLDENGRSLGTEPFQLRALKMLDKGTIVHKNRVDRTWRERNVLIKMFRINSPFLVRAERIYQTPEKLVYVMKFCSGGNLKYHMRFNRKNVKSEAAIKFIACELIMGLQAMHERNIIHRDIKPSNILLDHEGHVFLCDFSLVKRLSGATSYKTVGCAGTEGYRAPEVYYKKKYGYSCDYFGLGIILYQLAHASALPYCHPPPKSVTSLVVSKRLSPGLRQLLCGLLQIKPKDRIGCACNKRDGWKEVKQLPFFADVDWELVASRKIPSPIEIANEANFSPEPFEFFKPKKRILTAEQNKCFDGFEFNHKLGEVDVHAMLRQAEEHYRNRRRERRVEIENEKKNSKGKSSHHHHHKKRSKRKKHTSV